MAKRSKFLADIVANVNRILKKNIVDPELQSPKCKDCHILDLKGQISSFLMANLHIT